MEPLNIPSYQVSRAVNVVENIINYTLGGPHRLFELQKVISASKESIVGVGNTYYLEFYLIDYLNKRPPIKCIAQVLFYTNKQTAPKVTHKLEPEPENYTLARDQEFFNKFKSRSEPLVAEDIPDKFGNVAPDMEPILHLAQAASGYVKWKNSTEDTLYKMAVIKHVRQLIRDDAPLEFHFKMLIHDMVSQEIFLWLIEILWDPTEGLRVKNQHRLPKFNPDEKSS